jgi:hypothetical protein
MDANLQALAQLKRVLGQLGEPGGGDVPQAAR